MRSIALLIGLSFVCGCCPSGPVPRTSAAAAMFAPVSMRIHPIFSGINDWTGDDKPDGLEANLEFEDQFSDPTKAAGTIVFELFSYRQYEPDSRGERLVNPWVGSLKTLAEQQARWNRTSRTYVFQLEYPAVRADRDYVLTATFDEGATRFFDRIIIQGEHRSKYAPTTQRSTARSAAPGIHPASAATQPVPNHAPRS
jgi:hypothetical protein